MTPAVAPTSATRRPRAKTQRPPGPDAEQPTAWRSRIVGTGTEDPTQLVANPKNWRIHPKGQQDALGSVLDEIGWVQQVLVNRTTGNVVDGHLRVELAISRDEPAVPVLYVELSEQEEALVLASLDPLSAMAATDEAKLRELLAGVTISQADLAAQLASLAPSPKEGKTDPDDVPQVADEPYVKPGDLWLLGDHRLLCGDATNADDVARLMAGAQPKLMITDPPYGVEYDPTWRRRSQGGGQQRPACRLVGRVGAVTGHGGLCLARRAPCGDRGRQPDRGRLRPPSPDHLGQAEPRDEPG